jgi:fatty acid-binding protein DegV
MVDDHMNKYKDNISTDEIFVTHSGEITDDQVNLVVDHIKKYNEFKKIYVTQASCTCSTHSGPACLGILFMTKN